METKPLCIAIVGGTGKEGKGLAYRWAKAGYKIIIGSRSLEKARSAVDELLGLMGNLKVDITAEENIQAAKDGDIILLTVPYLAHKDMVTAIKEAVDGKILIDVTVPLVPPRVTRVQMPTAGSAALEAREILGENSKIVSAFQNISYEKLLGENEIGCDVLVSGEKESRQIVIDLIKKIGLTAFDAGPLENSVVAEGLTSILIGINKQFGVQSAGIKIIGID